MIGMFVKGVKELLSQTRKYSEEPEAILHLIDDFEDRYIEILEGQEWRK